MTEGEIRRDYNNAKNKKQQIKILADLNCCSVARIEDIIGEKIPERSPLPAASQAQEDIKLKDIINCLYCRLDKLNSQIKAMEDEYKKITIALEVIENMS